MQVRSCGGELTFSNHFHLVILDFVFKFLALFIPSMRSIAKRLGTFETLQTKNANELLEWFPNSADTEIINSAKQLYDVGILKN